MTLVLGLWTTLPAEKPSTGGSIVDVLDHILDKGIVIDAHVRVAVAGIDRITVEARVLVASIETTCSIARPLSTPWDLWTATG